MPLLQQAGQLATRTARKQWLLPPRRVGTTNPSINNVVGIRSLVSSSKPCLEKRAIPVPTMGDAITEGTIVEWTANVGEGVKADDVVAMVETDKVTVEIKADVDGVVTQHFAAVDETIEVGAPLYEIDTEAVATTMAASPTETTDQEETAVVAEKEPIAAATTASSSSSTAGQHRIPLIKFLGKEGWARLLSGQASSSSTSAEPSSSSSGSSAGVTVVQDPSLIHPMYGRPAFTEEEMEAIILGGASLAPNVLAPSSGARFL